METSQLLDEAKIKLNILQNRIENANWTREEYLFKNRWNLVKPKLQISKVPLSLVLKVLYRRSIFGKYLDEFNSQQHQNKFLNENKLAMTLYEQKAFTDIEWQYFKETNDDFLMGDSMWQLKDAIGKLELLNIKYFQDRNKCVRLNNCYINELDDGLYNYKRLKIIHMNGNWITRVPGDVLPRCLQRLDLYANRIDDLDKINKLPGITVLGLGRNLLHNDSQLHLLGQSQSLNRLRSLDISHNEICDLYHLLTCINTLQHLTSLELEGNPCYVFPSYKDDIIRNIPQLIYLDNVEILKKDRELDVKNNKTDEEAALIFSCHRIMGLPPPPKQKGVVHSIHLEISLPLLEEVVIPKVKPDDQIKSIDLSKPTVDNKIAKKGKKGKEDANKNKGPGKSKPTKEKKSAAKKSKGSSKKKVQGNLFYKADDEYENEQQGRMVNRPFCTERLPWSKIIQYPEESIVINSPEANNVTSIRNTFRTRVNVKVVYLKVQLPQKAKKQMGAAKGKKPNKKAADSGGNKKGSKNNKGKSNKNSQLTTDGDVKSKTQNPPAPAQEEVPKEVILKKVTLASFHCNLYPVSWSDKTLDFYWADHEDCKTDAICAEGSLRAINYEDPNKKGKKKPPAKGTRSLQEKDVELLEDEKQICPKIFTVQVGFGLKRSYNM